MLNAPHNSKQALLQIAEVDIIYRSKVKPNDRPKVLTSNHAFECFWEIYDHDKIEYREAFYLMLINRQNRVLGICKISEGGITGTVVDIRNVFQAALKTNATSIILCHNHPSGNLQPSDADRALTRKIKNAGEIMDIKLIDHLIVSSDSMYYSFADEGTL